MPPLVLGRQRLDADEDAHVVVRGGGMGDAGGSLAR